MSSLEHSVKHIRGVDPATASPSILANIITDIQNSEARQRVAEASTNSPGLSASAKAKFSASKEDMCVEKPTKIKLPELVSVTNRGAQEKEAK